MPTLDETGRWVGAQAWVELRLFEAVGAWVATTPEPEAKARFAAWSRHHAWHAELWLSHRPVVAGRDPEALVAPSDPATAAALALLAAEGDGTATVERLAALVRVVVPRLVVACEDRLAVTSPVQDAALRRTLRLVLTDLGDDRSEGERLLTTLLATADDVARAAAFQARVESLLVAGP